MVDWKDPERRIWLVSMLILLATFTTGALVGVAASRFLPRGGPGSAAWGAPLGGRGFQGPQGRDFGAGPGRPGPDLARELDLTDAQVRQVDSVLAVHRPRAAAIYREMQPQLQAQFDSTNAAIAGLLTADQRERFERFGARRREMLSERLGAGAPGPGFAFPGGARGFPPGRMRDDGPR